MQRSVFVFILAVLFFLLTGCSRESADPGVNGTNSAAVQADIPASEFTDADAALAAGSKLLDEGETDKAIEALNRAVELNPDLAEAYFKLGIAYSLVEVREQTYETVETTPAPTPAKGKKPAEVKTRSEEAFEKAVEAYKKILKANDQDDVAHYNLGRAYNKLNEDEEAAKELKEAVKLKPDDTEYQTELGAILIKLAKYAEAIPPLKKALELDPENSRAQELLSDAEAGKKRIDFATVKKDEKKPPKTGEPSNTNTETEPETKPTPEASPAARPKPSPGP